MRRLRLSEKKESADSHLSNSSSGAHQSCPNVSYIATQRKGSTLGFIFISCNIDLNPIYLLQFTDKETEAEDHTASKWRSQESNAAELFVLALEVEI